MDKRKRVSETAAAEKQKVLDLLLKVMQATEAGRNVAALRFDRDTEMVHVDFAGSGGELIRDGRLICVAMDSSWTMVEDVVENIRLY